MTKNGVEYDEINVADPQNVSQKELMIEMTGQMGVPVIRVGDDVFVGFDESKMKEVLGL